MAEHHAKTDLEVRFEMFKKQYHDRQAEAKRTGKPIPAHTQRWYDKQIEEYRTSLKRLGLIMTLSMPTVAEAVERIAAVKQKVDARAPVSEEQKKKARQAKVRQYTKGWRDRRVVTNEDLALLGCDSEWIFRRTGIKERRWASEDQASSDLAYEAAIRCLHNAGVSGDDVDLILVATAPS